MKTLTLAITFVLSLGTSFASKPFLLSFPEIRSNSELAVFANEKWAAVYSASAGAMYTMPRDSFPLPPISLSGRESTVELKGIMYALDPLRLNTIHVMSGFSDSVMALPAPSERSLAALRSAWKREVSVGEVQEQISPLRPHSAKLWFGLTAKTSSGAEVGGLGWYDPQSNRFGKTYSPALLNHVPRWIEGRSDTVYVFFERADGLRGGKLITFAIATGQLAELDLRAYGVPGDTLLNVSDWFATFMIATDKSVCIWPKGIEPWVWQTTAYAARDSLWLQFATYDPKSKSMIPSGDFFPLKVNFPAQVYAQIGPWAEMLAPSGIEATLPVSEWRKRGESLTTSDWGCGEKPCFARLTIRAKGEDRAMDILNTPLMLLEESDEVARVGMQAGWIELDRLIPVLTKE